MLTCRARLWRVTAAFIYDKRTKTALNGQASSVHSWLIHNISSSTIWKYRELISVHLHILIKIPGLLTTWTSHYSTRPSSGVSERLGFKSVLLTPTTSLMLCLHWSRRYYQWRRFKGGWEWGGCTCAAPLCFTLNVNHRRDHTYVQDSWAADTCSRSAAANEHSPLI